MKYKIIGTAVIAVAVVLALSVRPQAAHAGNTGFSDGYNLAKEDAQTGENNNHCGFENSDSYCLNFKAGYLAGQGSSLLHN